MTEFYPIHTPLPRMAMLATCPASAYAFEKVPHVGQRAVLLGLHFQNRTGRLGLFAVARHLAVDGETAAPQTHGRLCAADHQAAAFDVAEQRAIEFHHHVAGIGERGAHGIRSLPLHQDGLQACRGGARGRVGIHDPMGDVHPMDEKVGHRAAAEIPIPAPVAELVGIEGAVGGRAQKTLPIELGHVEGRHTAHRRDVILEPVGADQGHLAEAAVVDLLAGLREVLPTALLQSDLHHALGIVHGGNQRSGLFHRMGDGLFAVDVFAGAHRGDGDGHMPVVGRADHDGVDVFAIEDLAVVEVVACVGRTVLGFGFQAARFIDVAARDDFVLFGEFQLAQQILPATAGADGADAYAVVGSQNLAV
jgi:hypothetical protein